MITMGGGGCDDQISRQHCPDVTFVQSLIVTLFMTMPRCKNCKKDFCSVQKLRSHFLVYIPFYFGSYICVKCDTRYDTELRLIKHCFTTRHKNKSAVFCDIQQKRQNYFGNKNNQYFGFNNSKFDEDDILYLIEQTFITNIEIDTTVNKMDKNLSRDYSSSLDEIDTLSCQQEEFQPISPTELSASGYTTVDTHQIEYTAVKLSNGMQPESQQPHGLSFTVPSPPKFSRKGSGTPLLDEVEPTAACCCRKIANLEEKMEKNHHQMLHAIQNSKTELLEALQQSMKYQQSLCRAYIDTQTQTAAGQQKLQTYFTKLAETTIQVFKG